MLPDSYFYAHSTMDIRIAAYESHMKPQVAALFSAQYNVPLHDFSSLMDHFYDHPYQAGKCIRIVALQGEKVIGFQSFFFWPYVRNGKTFHAYQSGNSLVHPDYRGKGIFQLLLNHLEAHRNDFAIDFLLGFPIQASRNSLLRNGWKNNFDLEWFVLPLVSPASFFGDEKKKLARAFAVQSDLSIEENAAGHFRLSDEKQFTDWRKAYSTQQLYFYHVYRENGKAIEFTLKPSRRKKVIRELVLGNVRTESTDAAFLKNAFRDLIAAVKKSGAAAFVSFACNAQSNYTGTEILTSCGFRKIERKIFFAVKPFTDDASVEDASKWILYRSDIDTW